MKTVQQNSKTTPYRSSTIVEHASLTEAVEQAADGILITDTSGKVRYVNPAWTAMSGYSSKEAVGRNPRILKSGLQNNQFYKDLWDTILAGRVWQGELTNRRKNGTIYHEEMRISPGRDANGEIVSFIAVKRDITERRAAEETKSFLAAIVECSQDAIHSVALDGTILSWNHSSETLLGYSAEEIIGKNAEILAPPGRSNELYRCLEAVRNFEAMSPFETFLNDRAGRGIAVRLSVSPLRDRAGSVTGASAIVRDMRQHHESEQKLRESEERFRSMADSCPSMLWVTDAAGKVEFINREYREFSGLTCEEARTGEWRILLHHDDADAYIAAFESASRDHKPFSADARVRRVDGEWRLVGTHAQPRFSPRGEYLGHIGLRADITERREAEQELQFQHSLIRAIYEGSLDGILVVDADGIVSSHNKKLLDIWEIPFAEIPGGQEDSIVGSPHAQILSAVLKRVKDPESYEKRFQAHEKLQEASYLGEVELKNGRTLERYSTCLRNESGKYLGSARFFRDLTEHKHAEQALRETEERFRVMADSCPTGIWVTDARGGTLFANQVYRKFCGIVSEEMDPVAWLSMLHEDDAPGCVEVFECAVREHTPFMFVCRVRRADGSSRWVESNAVPRFSADGEFLGFVGTSQDVTERKEAEQALQESEERFHIIADSCPMPLWITSPAGEIGFVNRRFAEFCGNNSNRVEGSNWQQLLHPEDASKFLNGIFLALRDHQSFQSEVRVMRGDDEYRWLAASVAPRLSPSGEFLGHVGVGADITERKRAEQALQSSEEKFRELTENIHEVFWLKVPGRRDFLYISPAYEEIWGRTCASFYQNPESRLEAIHPDDLEPSRLVFAKQDRGEAVETEYRIRTPDGQEKWIRSRAFPVHDHVGQLVRIAGTAEDITEKKQYEAKLIQAQSETETANRRLSTQHAILDGERRILRSFIDNVPDLMFVKDVEGRFVVTNPEVARWADVENPEQMIGKTDFDFFPREFAESFRRADQQVIRTGEPMFDHEEKVGVNTTEEARYLLTTKVPLFDIEGHVTGIAGIGRDITARKRDEDVLRESNRQLQETTSRANQLALDAEAANRAKSEFLANMSHEIRTPMNGVLGMIGLLLGSDLEAEQRHYAEVVEDSAKSLLTLIDDILDFSKVEAGKLEIDTVAFNLHVLMGDFADAMAERVRGKNVEFVCAVGPNVYGLLQGDPGRLRQVLMNLVGNAMKFTRQGEVVLRADLLSETETAMCLRFSVRDTGIGIPKDKQKILFTSFTQVDASTTRKFGGTGLGLAISKKLVELMGGEIGMESQEGVGSEFWFTLDLGKQCACRNVESRKAPVKGARILVVDDNATNREVLTAQLQSWGAVVVAVENASTALACLRYAAAAGNPFQLAALDMMMPGMDGATLGGAILADDALKSTPLVMMTSLGQRGDALCFKEIGFAAYLVKPVRPSDLLDCLMVVLTGEEQPTNRSLITRHSLEAARRSNARILLVEDNFTNQEVASGMLQRMGWQADVTADGKQAIQALEVRPYDLVLMDVQIPEMDGYEATRVIRDPRSRVLNHDIPIIATTAHAMRGDIEKCLEAGMSDYVAKPIDPGILSKVVEKWLKRKVHSAEAETAVKSGTDHKTPPEKPQSVSLVFNREAFLERMMGDEEFAHEVAAGFVEELPSLLSSLNEQVEAGDLESNWKLAHKLKGSAGNVGGEALRDVALEIEQAGKGGDRARVVRLIPELETQAARLSEALQQWVG